MFCWSTVIGMNFLKLINNSWRKYRRNECLTSVWKSDEKLLIFASLISPSKINCLSNIKHSTRCFITRWNTSKFVKNTPLRVVFSTLFSVFHLVMKHYVSCLIYYLKIALMYPRFSPWMVLSMKGFIGLAGSCGTWERENPHHGSKRAGDVDQWCG